MISFLTIFIAWGFFCESASLQETRFFSGPPMCWRGQPVSSNVGVSETIRGEESCSPPRVIPNTDVRQCMSGCSDDEMCQGVTVDTAIDSDVCVIHTCLHSNTACEKADGGSSNIRDDNDDNTNTASGTIRYLYKHCANGGYWLPGGAQCRCRGGWIGEKCQNLPECCHDLIKAGYKKGGYWVHLDLTKQGFDIRLVKCIIETTSQYYYQIMKNRGNFDFNRSYSDYRNGFRDGTLTNWWIGLDTLSILTQLGHRRLQITMVFHESGKALFTKTIYENVILSNPSDGFRLSYRTAYTPNIRNKFRQGSLDECLDGHKGIHFSALDKNVHGDGTVNCAAVTGSGWWFRAGCYRRCNLFGWGPDYWSSNVSSSQRMMIKGVSQTVIASQKSSPQISIILFEKRK